MRARVRFRVQCTTFEMVKFKGVHVRRSRSAFRIIEHGIWKPSRGWYQVFFVWVQVLVFRHRMC